jgi:hypothetical protein
LPLELKNLLSTVQEVEGGKNLQRFYIVVAVVIHLQESQLQKYKKRWEELKANARKRRESKSAVTSPGTHSGEFVTSTSLTLTVNKDMTENKPKEAK